MIWQWVYKTGKINRIHYREERKWELINSYIWSMESDATDFCVYVGKQIISGMFHVQPKSEYIWSLDWFLIGISICLFARKWHSFHFPGICLSSVVAWCRQMLNIYDAHLFYCLHHKRRLICKNLCMFPFVKCFPHNAINQFGRWSFFFLSVL